MTSPSTTPSVNNPHACLKCLRRSWLLAHLAPYIERLTSADPGSSVSELLRLSNRELVATAAPEAADRILEQIEAIPQSRLAADLDAANCWAVCRHVAGFPPSLHDASDSPHALIGRGDPGHLARLQPELAVTLVGARRASSYGREVVRELGRELAAAGLLVISGLAFGIDACAHRGALEAGTTVAVLGCGPDVSYPAAHRSLWRRIQESGLVLSELPPGTGAWRWTFPARNRIMAALGGMTVVIEAAERSGSLMTAAIASDLGRTVGAVPGPVGSRLSAGPNHLLASGATIVRNADDVLKSIVGPGVRNMPKADPHPLDLPPRRAADR